MTRQAKQHDVGHGEVNDEDKGGGPHFLIEANVSFWLRDGGVDVHETAQGVQATALVAAPHETRQDGGSSESKQKNTHEEEANAFIVATPGIWTDVPNGNGAKHQPTGQLAVAPNERHVLEARREVLLETQHAVGDVDHRKHQTEHGGVSGLPATGQFVGLPVDQEGVVQDTGQCDGPWNWLVLHCESPVEVHSSSHSSSQSPSSPASTEPPAAETFSAARALTSSTMTVKAVRI